MVEFLRDRFVLVTVDARHAGRRKDWAGDFVRATRCVTFTAAGRKCAVTAGGKVLGNVHGLKTLRRVWKAWEELPESERAPGKISVGDDRPVEAAHEPPKGALVVRTYTRQLEREQDGTLRHTQPKDYPVPEPPKTGSGSPRRDAARFREAGHDFLWIPENEWRAMIPAEPRVGMRFVAPLTFKLRLLRHHLDPERGLGEAQWFTRARAADGKLELIVEEVSAQSLGLRFEGFARLARNGHEGLPMKYDPSLLGYVTYDREAKTVTGLKMIALGDVLNTPRGVRPGRHPLGIAFELVRDPTPAERVVPRGGRDDVKRYLEISSR